MGFWYYVTDIYAIRPLDKPIPWAKDLIFPGDYASTFRPYFESGFAFCPNWKKICDSITSNRDLFRKVSPVVFHQNPCPLQTFLDHKCNGIPTTLIQVSRTVDGLGVHPVVGLHQSR
ncbi:hypothetical protein KY285_020755 [Solanum tuberosum]|nr:hypothetical protein KY284_020503 [Solanum tuberosum]KAH0693658.1 hypothetical protein KY285_020755 [Solanum tuberosum]